MEMWQARDLARYRGTGVNAAYKLLQRWGIPPDYSHRGGWWKAEMLREACNCTPGSGWSDKRFGIYPPWRHFLQRWGYEHLLDGDDGE